MLTDTVRPQGRKRPGYHLRIHVAGSVLHHPNAGNCWAQNHHKLTLPLASVGVPASSHACFHGSRSCYSCCLLRSALGITWADAHLAGLASECLLRFCQTAGHCLFPTYSPCLFTPRRIEKQVSPPLRLSPRRESLLSPRWHII